MANKKTLKEVLPYILLIGGVVGIFCAGILTYDKIESLQHPGAHLNCNLNPIVACGPVINKAQASAFGFPNPFIGLVGFTVVATTGGAILAGATFKRWYWLCLEAGVLFAAAFVTWLQFETIYRIGALCPFCMVTWAATLPIFWYTTLYNFREGHITTPSKFKPTLAFAQKHHGDILILWFLLILTAITTHFWYYWRTLF
ncbi:MAG TPA: vitamin K epoxide reductase family protein [Verrucomicrobiae bacterium]|nr:vitamin K epoxide reductase family protein [Verrucomicrobiae bacterium]